MRILRSYEPGESVSIDILRKQKRMSLTWKVPEAREHRMRHELERVRREQERHEREEQSGLRRQLRRVARPQRVWSGNPARRQYLIQGAGTERPRPPGAGRGGPGGWH